MDASTPSTENQRPSSVERAPPTPLQDPSEETHSDARQDFDDALIVEDDTSHYVEVRKLISSVLKTMRNHGTVLHYSELCGRYRVSRQIAGGTWYIFVIIYIVFALQHEALAAVEALDGTDIDDHRLDVVDGGESEPYSEHPGELAVARLRSKCRDQTVMKGMKGGLIDEATLKGILGTWRVLR